MPGGILSLSAAGRISGSGVIWATRPTDQTTLFHVPHGVVEAYDPNHLTKPIWSSESNAADKLQGRLARFASITVVNGRVYVPTFKSTDVVGSQAEVVVYGLK